MNNLLSRHIKALLIMKGITQAELARRCGCTRANMNHIVSGRLRTPDKRKALAEALGVRVEEIWPEAKIND